MNNFRLILNKIARVKYFATAFLVGIFFLVGGIMAFNGKDTAKSKADATIISIVDGAYDDTTETYSHTVTLVFKDEKGVEHNVTTDAYDSSWKEGSVVTISYDPEDPEVVNFGNMSLKTVSYILMAIGAISILVGGSKLIITLVTPSKETNEFNRVIVNKK